MLPVLSNANNKTVDSLKLIIISQAPDSIKVNAYILLAKNCYQSSPDSAIDFCKNAEALAIEAGWEQGQLNSYGWLGYLLDAKGLVEEALEYNFKSLKYFEEKNIKTEVSTISTNIGMMYFDQGHHEEALSFFNKSLAIWQELKIDENEARLLTNIGGVYKNQKKYDLAKEYYNKSYAIRLKLNDNKGLVYTYGHFASLAQLQNQLDSALYYHQKALELSEEISYKLGILFSKNNLAGVYNDLKDYKKGEKFATESMLLAKEMGFPGRIKSAADNLYRAYKGVNKHKEALEMYELYVQMNDSLKNDETQKATIRQQTKYEFEKAELVKEQQLKEEIRNQKLATERRNNLQYSIILVAILFVFGGVLALGKVNISPKFAEGLIFFAFLIFFEFLLVLTDPYVDTLTNAEPMYKLLVNALLAGLIFPLHAFFEQALKKRLFKNNTEY